MTEHPEVALFMLCNPYNPVGEKRAGLHLRAMVCCFRPRRWDAGPSEDSRRCPNKTPGVTPREDRNGQWVAHARFVAVAPCMLARVAGVAAVDVRFPDAVRR